MKTIKYIDKGNTRQHLTDRLMESALNNVGIKADADELFRDIAENRLPVWIDELQTYDVAEVRYGRWKFDIDDNGWSWNKPYTCNQCGEWVETESNFCPNCGSRMDLDGDTE